MIPYPSIRSLLDSQVRRYGDRPFVISCSADGNRSELSFKEFFRRVTDLAALLQSQGLAHGDRIAIASGNGTQTVVHYFAVWMMGCVSVPITESMEEQKPFSILETRTSTALLEMNESTHRSQGEFRMGKKSKLRDDVLIVTGSDNGKLPRGIVLSHYNILVNAMAIAHSLRLADDQTILCAAQLSGVTGIVGCVMSALYAGCRIVLGDKAEPDFLLKLVDGEKVRLAFADRQMLTHTLTSSGFPGKDLPSPFKGFVSSHRHLSQDMVREAEQELSVPLVPGFELAEATCYSSLPLLSHSLPESTKGLPVGTPVASCEMIVLKDNGQECPEGRTGEIAVRGHHVMKGYLDDEKATADAFKFGWLHSGEKGFYTVGRDGKRYFTVTG